MTPGVLTGKRKRKKKTNGKEERAIASFKKGQLVKRYATVRRGGEQSRLQAVSMGRRKRN
jgi:hypothetical protein